MSQLSARREYTRPDDTRHTPSPRFASPCALDSQNLFAVPLKPDHASNVLVSGKGGIHHPAALFLLQQGKSHTEAHACIMQETNTAFRIQNSRGSSLLADFDASPVCLSPNPRSPIRLQHWVSQEAWWANHPDWDGGCQVTRRICRLIWHSVNSVCHYDMYPTVLDRPYVDLPNIIHANVILDPAAPTATLGIQVDGSSLSGTPTSTRKWTTGYGTTTAISICCIDPADTVQRVSGVIDCGGKMGADLGQRLTRNE